MAISPEPSAPNTSILFVAWMLSPDGQDTFEEVNPATATPFDEGGATWRLSEDAGIEQIVVADVQILAEPSEKLDNIVSKNGASRNPCRRDDANRIHHSSHSGCDAIGRSIARDTD
ncbi:hypothetical protein E1212_08010 [Jiangella ureilytica]|uniref:Uncharacterized protein n=1 Tax=Jiangella ureilytica TaxID=2530374 RepID=A0A4R4RS38_9ACTN|nr:hypothetical protein [Jiangella ureilytica]TDC52787.1 hypothetical protein E1212_08010 [Jiangella ureilytica]